ncbi:hypothetical protein VTN00DRAFT_6349 [Thermoascus crustaceus]|uniref:uncharacterized protein n=1 Tax=Thermoascus crustaceus TaxID=5088 RepID=UPI00374410A6
MMAGEIYPDSDFADAEIIFVMGGPGAGKSTLCARLAEDLGLIHLCPGEMLREFEYTGPLGVWYVVKEAMDEGKLCPIGLIMYLLQAQILRHMKHGARAFLIDGFPRSTDQFFDFSRHTQYCKVKFALHIKCSPMTMYHRFTKLALADQIPPSSSLEKVEDEFQKRIDQFSEENMQIIGYLDSIRKVVTIDSELLLEESYAAVREAVEVNLAEVRQEDV